MTLNKILFALCLFIAALTAVLQVWAIFCALAAVYIVRTMGAGFEPSAWASVLLLVAIVVWRDAKKCRPIWIEEARKWAE